MFFPGTAQKFLQLRIFVVVSLRRTAESARFLAEVGDLVQRRVDTFAVVGELQTKLALVVTDAGI